MPSPTTTRLPVPRSWDEFEDICADILKRVWGDPYLTRNGRSGQKQHGVDIYGTPAHLNGSTGPRVFSAAQCKNMDSLSLADIVDEVKKAEGFSPRPAEYLVLTTATRDAALQSDVRNHSWPFRVEVWFWEDLSLELSGHQDLLQKHFPTWTKATVGTEDVMVRVLSSAPEDYQYNDATGVFLHRNDVKLRLIFDWSDESDRAFDEPWVREFPDPKASRQVVYVEYDGARIRTFYFVWADGARYLLPYPKSRNDLRISPTQYHIGKILSHPFHGYTFDDGLVRARITVDAAIDFRSALHAFMACLDAAGYPKPHIWLPHDSMILSKDGMLHVFLPEPPIDDEEMLLPGDLVASDEGTLMLVSASDVSYVTLLMDTFGSDDEDLPRSGPIYLWTTPYVEKPIDVVSSASFWSLLRAAQRANPTLSSLDYAFGLSQVRPNSAL